MPLIHGYSRAAIGENVRRERRRGRKPAQAIAIAYSEARRAARAHGKRPSYLYRRANPSSLGPLVLIGGLALLLLKARQSTNASSGISTSAASSTMTSGLFSTATATPVPVPVQVGTPLPPAAPMGAGAGGWALSPGGPTGQQWVWVSSPGTPDPLFAPASVPVPAGTISQPPQPVGAGPGAWRLVVGGATGEQWMWVSSG